MHRLRTPLALWLVAFGLRLTHVAFLSANDPMFDHPVMDPRWHVEWASGKTRILPLTLYLKIIPGSQKAEARPFVQCGKPSKASVAT